MGCARTTIKCQPCTQFLPLKVPLHAFSLCKLLQFLRQQAQLCATYCSCKMFISHCIFAGREGPGIMVFLPQQNYHYSGSLHYLLAQSSFACHLDWSPLLFQWQVLLAFHLLMWPHHQTIQKPFHTTSLTKNPTT